MLLAALCPTLGIMAVLFRVQRRPGPVLVESALIVSIYAMGAWLLAARGRP